MPSCAQVNRLGWGRRAIHPSDRPASRSWPQCLSTETAFVPSKRRKGTLDNPWHSSRDLGPPSKVYHPQGHQAGQYFDVWQWPPCKGLHCWFWCRCQTQVCQWHCQVVNRYDGLHVPRNDLAKALQLWLRHLEPRCYTACAINLWVAVLGQQRMYLRTKCLDRWIRLGDKPTVGPGKCRVQRPAKDDAT